MSNREVYKNRREKFENSVRELDTLLKEIKNQFEDIYGNEECFYLDLNDIIIQQKYTHNNDQKKYYEECEERFLKKLKKITYQIQNELFHSLGNYYGHNNELRENTINMLEFICEEQRRKNVYE